MTERITQAEQLKDAVMDVLVDMKGFDVKAIDVTRLTDVTDYMVIASGTSDRHVKSMARELRDRLRERDVKPIGVEGENEGDWVLIDLGDVVVHVMRPQTREYYDLERLWNRDVEDLIRLNRDSKE